MSSVADICDGLRTVVGSRTGADGRPKRMLHCTHRPDVWK